MVGSAPVGAASARNATAAVKPLMYLMVRLLWLSIESLVECTQLVVLLWIRLMHWMYLERAVKKMQNTGNFVYGRLVYELIVHRIRYFVHQI